MNWKGVIPAITTNLAADLTVDHAALAVHCRWLIDSGCTGLVVGGSLGEAATLSFEEKIAIVRTSVAAVAGRAPIVLGIASLSTLEAVALAQAAEQAGAQGLMVLPPYVYSSDWREMKTHVSAVIAATKLSCLLYNNPPAYKTDFLPEQIAELASLHPNLHAVKESSGDTRRVTAIQAVVGPRLAVLVGMDDAIVEGIYAGAVGWIAGLVNAFPVESVALFNLASRGEKARAAALYAWFLPLLRLDTVPKFVQLIKWVQAEVGRGTPYVRAPRLTLAGPDLAAARAVLTAALQHPPAW
ncbi:MAG: dihydrodipicolinate synthase family protein [Opitutia bacterium Tous-C10FEB]|nr:MAG: dihydrodipicolinate synthase family protein [Opitutae bacterium Tous-C10FEB]